MIDIILKSFYAFVATLGFGVLFNIKGKNLIFASFGGAIGWFFYSLPLSMHYSEVTSLFIGSVALSIYGEIMARFLKSPVTTFVICALIPLVPGGGMYYTMFDFIQGDLLKALDTGLITLSNAGALAVGVIFVSSIARLISSAKNITKSKKS